MECLLKDFDYAVITPDGQHHIVARSDETSFLTKHLKVYGGTGYYDNCKIGRVLRNFTFSGKGLVHEPANPNSIIFADMSLFSGKEDTNFIISQAIREVNSMANDNDAVKIGNLQSELAQTKRELDDAITKLTELDAKAVQEKFDNFQSAIDDRDAKIEELVKASEAHAAELSEVNDKISKHDEVVAEVTERATKAETQLEEIKVEASKKARMDLLRAQVEMTDDELVATIKKFDNLDDEGFAAIVELAGKNKVITETTDDETSDGAEAGATEETLENVEETDEVALASTSEGSEDEVEEARAGLSSFIEKKYLTKANSDN